MFDKATLLYHISMPVYLESTPEEVTSIKPDTNDSEEISALEVAPNLSESPVYVWGLGEIVYSHRQIKFIFDQTPEIRLEYDPIEAYASIDSKAWESHRNIIETGGSIEDIGAVLEAWKYANTQYNRLYHAPKRETEFIQDYWSSKSMVYHGSLERILHTGSRSSEDESERFLVDARVQGLLFDKTFEQREELLDYLTYRLWSASDHVKMTTPYPGEELGPRYKRNKENYDNEKTYVMPLVAQAVQAFAEDGNISIVRRVFESLETMDETDTAAETLLASGLSDKARLNLAVQHMNVFGVVPTIDKISAKEEGNAGISRLYKTMQGKDIEEIMSSLTEVYKAINFHEYVLNNPELTARESNLIQEQVTEYARKVGKTPQQVRIIDVGAGTGRHSVALHRLGYDITALEFEQHHVKKIKEQEPNVKIIVGDWHNIPYPDGRFNSDVSPEFFYCLGRTILHNNTPEKMARFFDEMQRVLTYDGVGIIDIPKIPEAEVSEVTDQYSAEIERYTKHLESLGVDPGRARNIFDGPDERHKFNRMTMTDAQFRAYAKIFGFKVANVEEMPIGEQDLFNNSYYVIEKDADFVIDEMKSEEFMDLVRSIGLLDPGTDYNRYVDAWGLPLGIPLMYNSQLGALRRMREVYRDGRLGEIRTQMDNGTVYFEVSHIPSPPRY